MTADPPRTPAHVVIVGGGFAALEAALALRALAADRIRLTLISPEPTFAYRPAATVEAFAESQPRAYDLSAIAEDLGASYYRSRLEAVASKVKRVRLSSGARLGYDTLILAIGARSIASIPGALTFRDQRDVSLFRRLLDKIDAGLVRQPVFAVPSGCSWPLPLYELALFTAARARERAIDAEVTIVTPERAPLAIFGPEASRAVNEVLADLGVRFVGSSAVGSVHRGGSLALQFAGTMPADRVVAVPQLRGQRISGIPSRWWGFVPVDASGRVHELADVYAAGDMTTMPIKQGGLAAQQADRVAHAIAATLGFDNAGADPQLVLRARLIGGQHPLFLHTELDERGRATATTLVHPDDALAASWSKVFGRHLTAYLERREPLGRGRPLAAA